MGQISKAKRAKDQKTERGEEVTGDWIVDEEENPAAIAAECQLPPIHKNQNVPRITDKTQDVIASNQYQMKFATRRARQQTRTVDTKFQIW